MATYPAGIFTYTNRTSTQSLLAATHTTNHNEIGAEVVAIETELGTNPKGIYVDVGTRLDALAALIPPSTHTQNTDVGSSSATFYLNGASGALLKEVGGAYAVRNNADTLYVDFTCDDLVCSTINGITSVQLASIQTDSHSHANKGLLDTYTQTEVNLASAVALKHTQNTDTGSTNETFQLNNGNVLSAKVKVDDLTPTIVDIRNAADNAFAPIRALEFRGDLQVNNADVNRATIRFDDANDRWQFSNDGVTFIDFFPAAGSLSVGDTASIDLTLSGAGLLSGVVLPAGVDHNLLLNYSATYHFPVGGAATHVQYNDGAGGLAGEAAFYYNAGTDTLYVPNINVSGLIVGVVVAGGTTSDTWEVNSDGNGLTISTVGMTGDATLLGTDWISLEALGIQDLTDPGADRIMFWDESSNFVTWLTVSTGLNITGTNLTNSDTGSAAVAAHNLAFTHSDIHVPATILDTASINFGISGQEITGSVLPAGVDHNSLNNYDANRHVDHTAVSISTGTGLTGGGDISATRTLSLSHLGIQSLTDPGADRIMFWDDSASAVVWLTLGTGLSITDTTINATGTVTDLDSAYNGGNTIDCDTSPVTITVSDTDNNTALEVVQNDVTNDPDAMGVTNTGTGAGILITASGNGPHITLVGDPTVAAPADGDLWYTGTSLNFYDGATTTDLLAGGGATLTRATFTNASLTAGVLTITHSAGLSAPYTVMVTIFDNNNQQIIPDSITGATNTVAVDLSSYVTAGGGSITGTWGYGYIA